jgi:hypothetical protein
MDALQRFVPFQNRHQGNDLNWDLPPSCVVHGSDDEGEAKHLVNISDGCWCLSEIATEMSTAKALAQKSWNQMRDVDCIWNCDKQLWLLVHMQGLQLSWIL